MTEDEVHSCFASPDPTELTLQMFISAASLFPDSMSGQLPLQNTKV